MLVLDQFGAVYLCLFCLDCTLLRECTWGERLLCTCSSQSQIILVQSLFVFILVGLYACMWTYLGGKVLVHAHAQVSPRAVWYSLYCCLFWTDCTLVRECTWGERLVCTCSSQIQSSVVWSLFVFIFNVFISLHCEKSCCLEYNRSHIGLVNWCSTMPVLY